MKIYNNKVLVGMSGGVDSGIACFLLKKQGFEPIGITLKLQNTKNFSYRIETAKMQANFLSIPHYVKDISSDFEEKVIKYFSDEYLSGRTPNPCIVCNEKIKFNYLLKEAENLNCSFIATGHYAKIEYNKKNNVYLLKKGIDCQKEQSYFLYRLSQDILKKLLLPLGNWTKDEVVKLQKEIKLPRTKSSKDICFLEGTNYRIFLKERYEERIKDGYIKDKNGKILGKHKGLCFYTIGQRKKINISLGEPFYVISKNIEENTIILGGFKDCYRNHILASNCNFILPPNGIIKAKIRYNQQEEEVEIEKIDQEKITVKFKKPLFAPSSGQSIVFYQEDIVLGGGIIE